MILSASDRKLPEWHVADSVAERHFGLLGQCAWAYLQMPSWPEPNLTLLGNALQQTGWKEAYPTSDNWREVVRGRIRGFDWNRVVADVRPFIDQGTNLDILSRENVLRVLEP